MNAYAAVDIGSNSIRLLIAEIDNGIRTLTARRRITRLGDAVDETGRLGAESMDRSLDCLEDYARDMQVQGVKRYRAVATAAVRRAANGMEFAERVLADTGLSVDVISGLEEAQLSANGVLSVIRPMDGCSLVFDVGGGSTEFILCRDAKVLRTVSVDLGAVSLTGTFSAGGDPPSASSLAAMEHAIESEFSKVKSLFDLEECSPSLVVGTAGTATTLAAMLLELREYDPARINGYFAPLNRLESLFHTMSAMDPEARSRLAGLEPGRADIICAGTLIVLRILKIFGVDGMTVSDAGLLEGILLEVSGQPFH